MAINFSQDVYLHCFNTFARPITVTPNASQPGQPGYSARGIFNTEPYDVAAEDQSIFSDQRTILDILEEEYPVQPIQGDVVFIPATSNGIGEEGTFEVTDIKRNGGGETTLLLRRMVTASP